jgi:3-methyladenine DNA glycosylase AlkD
MKTDEAKALGERLAALVHDGQIDAGWQLLTPYLSQRIKFAMLERVGAPVGAGPVETTNRFLARVAAADTEGGWVIIGSALREQLDRDLSGAFERAHTYIIAANVWYGTDILGERVPGPALVAHFEQAYALLENWRSAENRWVRRAVGVGVHFWAKRSLGKSELAPQAEALLTLLEPLFTEWEMDAVKGVGWGLKTLGRKYPDLTAAWLENVLSTQPKYRAIMLRKALTYLPQSEKERLTSLAAA